MFAFLISKGNKDAAIKWKLFPLIAASTFCCYIYFYVGVVVFYVVVVVLVLLFCCCSLFRLLLLVHGVVVIVAIGFLPSFSFRVQNIAFLVLLFVILKVLYDYYRI